MDFHEKHVVVTGGSNGIGLALSALLTSKGARVTSLDQATPAKAIDGVTHVHCDVTKLDDVRMALVQSGGHIDILVNNAGIVRRGPTLSHPEDEFDALFAVNAKGIWLMLKEAAALLAPHATILHVSSYRALQSPDDPGLYAASKAAGEHIARCAAAGHPGWTLKIAHLGPFDTAMAREGSPVRSPAEAAELLADLIASDHDRLTYDPEKDDYKTA